MALLERAKTDFAFIDALDLGEDDRVAVILRNRECDRQVRRFMAQHPRAPMVHIGFDARFGRVDDPSSRPKPLSSQGEPPEGGPAMLNLILAAALTSSLFTMYARDPITSSLCFTDGQAGGLFQGGLPKNRCSHLTFGTYASDGFSAGIQGGEKAVIIDLGDSKQYARAHGAPVYVGGDAAFAALELKEGALVLSIEKRETIPLPETTALRGEPGGAVDAPAKLGHLYVVRVVREGQPDLLVKFHVIAHVPEQYTTIRWARLN